jgi:predicted DNA-binding transcriptional regulator YafY
MTSGRPNDDPVQNMTHADSPMSQGRVERFVTLIRVLEQHRKIRKSEFLKLAGVRSQSSFKRLKAELTRAGLPLVYLPSDKHYHLRPDASFIRYGVDARTRAQVAQVRAAVSALGGVAQEALEDVLEFLEARIALDDPTAAAVVSSRRPQPRGGAEFYTTLDRALSAVREHRWLSFQYEPTAGGERAERTMAPYAVHAHDGRYYVWGTLEGDDAAFPVPRLFALDRMTELRIEDDTFVPDTSLDLGDALRHSFGTMVSTEPPHDVVVRIMPEAAAFVACRRWPAETDVSGNADGGLRLTFSVTKNDEHVAWVLSFGGAATIESPVSAREELRMRAEAIVAACARVYKN